MNTIACTHCNQLNPDSQKTCERCGQSLLWSAVGSNRRSRSLHNWGWAVLGLGLGLVAARLAPSTRSQAIAVSTPPRIDVVFAIDSTGSMGDEIEVVKQKVSKMMQDIQAGDPQPDVRFGLVAYRDHGDAYVTKAYPLTTSLPSIQSSLIQIEAGGGGDTPEAVGAGLDCAVNEMNWDADPKASRMIFLIGDAGPHQVEEYREALQAAERKGIKVNTWGCSGLQDCGQKEFQEIALLGGGEFQFLTYQQEVVRQDGSRARLVFQGRQCYEVSSEEKWSEGADKISAKRQVTEVTAPGAAGGADYRSSSYAPSSARLENNLDTVLVRQVQAEARRKGVSY